MSEAGDGSENVDQPASGTNKDGGGSESDVNEDEGEDMANECGDDEERYD